MPLEYDMQQLEALRMRMQKHTGDADYKAIHEQVEMARGDLDKALSEAYREKRRLLSEKSILTAETSKGKANVKYVIKTLKSVRFSAAPSMSKAIENETRILRRLEQNERRLHSHDDLRSTRLRRQMRATPERSRYSGEHIENMLGNAAIRTAMEYTQPIDRQTAIAIEYGETALAGQVENAYRLLRTGSIATPLPERQAAHDDGRLSSYLALAEYMPEISKFISQGLTVSQLRSNPDLRAIAQSLVSANNPVSVIQTSSGGYQTIDIENQRRVIIARMFEVKSVAAIVVAQVNG